MTLIFHQMTVPKKKYYQNELQIYTNLNHFDNYSGVLTNKICTLQT